MTFLDFLRLHHKPYKHGTAEYEHRQALFQLRLSQVQQHNALLGRKWTAGINRLADFTEQELMQLRGYRPQARPGSSAASAVLGLLGGKAAEPVDLSKLPSSLSWQSHLQAMQDIQDQGPCGSCWAFATSTVLRAHAELFQQDRRFSEQQILSCTRNPNHCGGTGGCTGATIELAMDYVARNGCSDDWDYLGRDAPCPSGMTDVAKASFLAGVRLTGRGGEQFGMMGYSRLPENELAPVLLSLYRKGPVGISLATGYLWNLYESGIMDGCSRDTVIDHAVVLVGYGEDAGMKYWLIQNSWGAGWGEGGYLRLERHGHEEEAAYCGVDNQPEVGSGCTGGPPQVTVCGTCGILYDTVIPNFNLSEHGWWSRKGGKQT